MTAPSVAPPVEDVVNRYDSACRVSMTVEYNHVTISWRSRVNAAEAKIDQDTSVYTRLTPGRHCGQAGQAQVHWTWVRSVITNGAAQWRPNSLPGPRTRTLSGPGVSGSCWLECNRLVSTVLQSYSYAKMLVAISMLTKQSMFRSYV